jgi:hypothetical protein
MAQQAKLDGRNALTRRASALSARMSQEKVEEARRLSPAQRLLLALELSDTCHELQRACSAKR